jgi:hypothetical protein
VSFKNGFGLLFSRRPDSDAGILAGGDAATILEDGDAFTAP